ncbi:hypothetical protein SNE40_006705 [Patella caerulea]|uniref:Hexosyltransferase n=1 Tax=Patella caerulea TaxID=87958 RepID=A0AAN8JUN0_PATCE
MRFRPRLLALVLLSVTAVIFIHNKVMTYYTGRSPETTVAYKEYTDPTATIKPFYGHPSLMPYEDFFVPGKNTTFSLDYNFSLDGSKICKDEDPYMVIFILSLHDKTAQRAAIRQTWGSVATSNRWPGTTFTPIIKIVFLFGVHPIDILNEIVRKESSIHNDIVQADFVDAYANLTLKVLMGFKWMTSYCPKTKFVMKTDEDSFIVLPKLVRKLESVSMDNSILGPYVFAEGIAPYGKHKLEKEEYPLAFYPPHCKGNMYVMSSNLATKLRLVANHFKYFRIEDVFLTGILAKVFDVRHINLKDSEYHKFKVASACELLTGSVILSQKISEIRQYQIWQTFRNKILCS